MFVDETTSPTPADRPLVSSSPAQGMTLAAAPTEVNLTFGEPVSLPDAPMSVTGPEAPNWDAGPLTLTDSTVTAQVTPGGPAGWGWVVIAVAVLAVAAFLAVKARRRTSA